MDIVFFRSSLASLENLLREWKRVNLPSLTNVGHQVNLQGMTIKKFFKYLLFPILFMVNPKIYIRTDEEVAENEEPSLPPKSD